MEAPSGPQVRKWGVGGGTRSYNSNEMDSANNLNELPDKSPAWVTPWFWPWEMLIWGPRWAKSDIWLAVMLTELWTKTFPLLSATTFMVNYYGSNRKECTAQGQCIWRGWWPPATQGLSTTLFFPSLTFFTWPHELRKSLPINFPLAADVSRLGFLLLVTNKAPHEEVRTWVSCDNVYHRVNLLSGNLALWRLRRESMKSQNLKWVESYWKNIHHLQSHFKDIM